MSPGAGPEVAWIDAHVERTGPVEVTRVRPWATVRRVPTAGGPVWMKACGSGTAFEAPLYELLAREVPESVLVPIAVDTARSSRTLASCSGSACPTCGRR